MPGVGGSSPPPSNVQFSGARPGIYTPTGQPAADQAYQALVNQIYNQGFGGLQSMGAGTPASNYWPAVQADVSSINQNPYAASAQNDALRALNFGEAAGTQQLDVGGQLLSQVPGLFSAGQQVFQTGFDPQQALYNSLYGKVGQQAAASNAQSGVAGPYAAGRIDDALTNFGIDWQNQQLGRQLQGLKGLEGGALAGANVAQTGAGLQNAGIAEFVRSSQLPYDVSVGQSQAGLGALGQGINLGNNAYQIPQLALNDLQSYLGLGQAAGSQALGASQLGGNQQLQQAQLLGAGLQGVGGLTALGGPNGLGLWGSGGSLFGSGSATDTGLAAAVNAAPFTTDGLGGGVGLGASDLLGQTGGVAAVDTLGSTAAADAGGFGLADALPLAALS